METLKAIANRKSIRSYMPGKPEASAVEAIIGAANKAPNAGPVHISVITNKGVIKTINDKAKAIMLESGNDFLVSRASLPGYEPLYGAPAVMIFSAPAEHKYAQANTAGAATCAAIAATDLGLGSCYAVTPTMPLNADKDFAKKLGVPAGFTAVCALLLGYTDDPDKFSTRKTPVENVNYYN